MILICLAADFDQASETVVLNELMHEILVHLLNIIKLAITAFGLKEGSAL